MGLPSLTVWNKARVEVHGGDTLEGVRLVIGTQGGTTSARVFDHVGGLIAYAELDAGSSAIVRGTGVLVTLAGDRWLIESGGCGCKS